MDGSRAAPAASRWRGSLRVMRLTSAFVAWMPFASCLHTETPARKVRNQAHRVMSTACVSRHHTVANRTCRCRVPSPCGTATLPAVFTGGQRPQPAFPGP
jgi:hypothetical protein